MLKPRLIKKRELPIYGAPTMLEQLKRVLSGKTAHPNDALHRQESRKKNKSDPLGVSMKKR